MPKKISREALYNLVWQKPMIHAAKDFGISSTSLRKICVNHEIPVPPAGHWAKINAGKKVQQTPLPQAQKKTIEQVVIYGSETTAEASDDRLHHSAKALAEALDKALPSEGRYKICINECFRIDISPSAISRTVLLVNDIFRATEACGYSWRYDTGGAKLIVDGQELCLSLKEDAHIAGKLTLALDDLHHKDLRRNWKDGVRRAIEDEMIDFLVGVEIYAAAEKDRAEDNRHLK
ncbi:MULTISPECIES: hypothetical protein [Pseudomonadota]|uniref:hypothetical protein n=1 Tax=Pseudomonadota TaxID=1224 RepID=UPI0027315B72|nr:MULTISPECIES: hypothetical protein [Pseudomonadota]MDP1627654.1 hypothetical protein [Parvibaculum sp.]MDP2243756.1 hypothetical protein [Pseudomonas sp.]